MTHEYPGQDVPNQDPLVDKYMDTLKWDLLKALKKNHSKHFGPRGKARCLTCALIARAEAAL